MQPTTYPPDVQNFPPVMYDSEGGLPTQEESVDTPIPALDQDELNDLLLALLLNYDRDDEITRDAQLRLWVRNDLFIKGITNVYYSTISRDYRSLADGPDESEYDDDLDDKVVNLLKPYRESIVAALSVGLPVTRFYPEDADNADDILAAQTWTRAADLIRRKNKAKFLFIRALSIYWAEGFVAAYNYADTDSKYGVQQVPRAPVDQTTYNHTAYCPDCAGPLAQGQSDQPFPPDQPGPTVACPDCAQNVQTMVESEPTTTQVSDGFDSVPKTKECVEIYGGRHVQVAPYARNIQQTPYLILNEDFNINQMKEEHREFADKISVGGDRMLYDRWARLGFRYRSDYATKIVTRRKAWFHPWAFHELGFDNADLLLQMFPDGICATFVGDILVKIIAEKMEDHWTVATDPMEDYIHGEPPMNASVPIQEMYTEATQLTLETMRYSITETFIDSTILDLKKYALEEIKPGTITPVKAPLGGNVGASITSTKPATLSQEVNIFREKLQEDGQFTSGAFPSIYGGQIQTGSDTAAEYSMSRAQAMQRLQLFYQMMSFFWSDLEGKATRDFLANLRTDQSDVVSQGKSAFITVWIKQSELTGAIGTIEPESSEQFPVSWAQKRDALYQLIQLNNDFLNEAIYHPENRSYVAEVLGLPDLYIPGDEDRVKQLHEILELIQGQPIPTGQVGPDGQPALMPSIPIDPGIDDDVVQIGVIKAWCISPVGIYVKQTNQMGMANVEAHMKMHMAHQAQMQQQQMMAQAQAQAGPQNKPKGKSSAKNLPPPQ